MRTKERRVYIAGETEKAYFITLRTNKSERFKRSFWVPKSQVEVYGKSTNENSPETVMMSIPEWILEKNRLAPKDRPKNKKKSS